MKKKIYSILFLLIITQVVLGQKTTSGAMDVKDPFAPFLTGKPPVILKNLGIETRPDNIRIHRMVYLSRVVGTLAGNDSLKVFAAIAFPPGKGIFPGIVRLHGGGGIADIPAAVSSARVGFVSLVLDIPGIAGKDKSPENKWLKQDQNKITAKPDVSCSALFDGVLASIQAVYLLKSMPGVDPAKIGVAGASWGGYVSTMVAALLNDDLAAGWSVFGSGSFLMGSYEKSNIEKLPPAEREEWIKYLDPGSRAGKITKPFHISTASNDRHWSWMAVQQTLSGMRGPVSQLYSPNTNHLIKCPGGSGMIPFFNQYLKNGKPMPEITAITARRMDDGDIEVRFHVKNTADPVNPRLYYTLPEKKPVWTESIWDCAAAMNRGNWYEATIVASKARGKTDMFAYISDHQPELGQDSITVTSLIFEVN